MLVYCCCCLYITRLSLLRWNCKRLSITILQTIHAEQILHKQVNWYKGKLITILLYRLVWHNVVARKKLRSNRCGVAPLLMVPVLCNNTVPITVVAFNFKNDETLSLVCLADCEMSSVTENATLPESAGYWFINLFLNLYVPS